MRPKYGDSYDFDRILYPYFYTSNSDKLIQARLILSRFGYRVRHYRSDKEPYDEDYSSDTQTLLTNALTQLSDEFAIRSTVFVEDTSLRIEALSNGPDYPGMAVKEWFANTSFDELDRSIRARDGSRRATVKSDIALRIPGLSRPIFFHGETRGSVAPSPPGFLGSLQYPWLSPDNFNGWFIPDGSVRRLGEMEFEDSLHFDFRAKSLIALVERLEELSAALNLGRTQIYVRRSEDPSDHQLSLPVEAPTPVFIVVGHKCAGKTTFSDLLVRGEGVMALEGSTVLREIAAKENREINNSTDALQYLAESGFDIVAKEVARFIHREDAAVYIVSGMRTIEEVAHLLEEFPSARLVWIEADVQDRFERHLRRARDRDVSNLREFVDQDESQMQFGLLRAGPEIADYIIRNDQDLGTYHTKILALATSRPAPRSRVSNRSELHRCLLALGSLGGAATCEEISEGTKAFGAKVRKYNTNRALKEVPEFAERIEPAGAHLLRYRLTDVGRTLLQLLEREPAQR